MNTENYENQWGQRGESAIGSAPYRKDGQQNNRHWGQFPRFHKVRVGQLDGAIPRFGVCVYSLHPHTLCPTLPNPFITTLISDIMKSPKINCLSSEKYTSNPIIIFKLNSCKLKIVTIAIVTILMR